MTEALPRNPAETYENYFVPAMFFPWATILLRHSAPRSGERVLDVACGTGVVSRLAAPLVGASGQVVALDFNASMLVVARTLPVTSGAAITWQEGNAMSLPFPTNAFNLVLCQHGLQFFPDRLLALREMRRVLVSGGRALVIVLQSLEQHTEGRVLATLILIAYHSHLGIEIFFCDEGINHAVSFHFQRPFQVIVTSLKKLEVIGAIQPGRTIGAHATLVEFLVDGGKFRRALEQQVLKQVRHAGFAVVFMTRSHKIGDIDGNGRLGCIGKQQHLEAVFQAVFCDALNAGHALYA